MYAIEDEKARGLSELRVNGVHFCEARRPDIYADGLLHDENERLRPHIKALYERLNIAEKRHTVILPAASDRSYGGHYWVVPVCVGSWSPIVQHPDETSSPKRYHWTFERIYSDAGMFWRALPFVTEPERS